MPRACSRGRQASCRLHASRCCSRQGASRAHARAFLCLQEPTDFCPEGDDVLEAKPTEACECVVAALRGRGPRRGFTREDGSASSSVRKRSTSTSCRRYSTRNTDDGDAPTTNFGRFMAAVGTGIAAALEEHTLAGRVDHSRRWAPCVCVATSTSTRAPRARPRARRYCGLARRARHSAGGIARLGGRTSQGRTSRRGHAGRGAEGAQAARGRALYQHGRCAT